MIEMLLEALNNVMDAERKIANRRVTIEHLREVQNAITHAAYCLSEYNTVSVSEAVALEELAFFFTPTGLHLIYNESYKSAKQVYEFPENMFSDYKTLQYAIESVYYSYPGYYFSFPFAEFNLKKPISDNEFMSAMKKFEHTQSNAYCVLSDDSLDRNDEDFVIRFGLVVHIGSRATKDEYSMHELKAKLYECNKMYEKNITFEEFSDSFVIEEEEKPDVEKTSTQENTNTVDSD